jgi:hypothetical protein
MSKVALVIVFNHRFDQNISVLDELYRDRFSDVYYLVPFYDGDRSDVIPVYENSFYFQGYFSQGFKHYFREEYEHYIFLADDMVLNPAINEDNYKEFFQLTKESSFIPEIFTLDNFWNTDTLVLDPHRGVRQQLNSSYTPDKFTWWRTIQAIWYSPNKSGVESSKEIPSYEEANRILKKHGFDIKPLQHTDLYGSVKLSVKAKNMKRMAAYFFKQKLLKKKYHLKYPMVASYSDLVIVSASSIKKFAHYCGVFAATELFVELAAPTALLLSSDKVVTEPAIGKRGAIYWVYSDKAKEEYEKEMQKYNYIIQRLMSDFPSDKLYMHPVKLSKWKQEVTIPLGYLEIQR